MIQEEYLSIVENYATAIYLFVYFVDTHNSLWWSICYGRAIQAIVGASDAVPCQYLDVMESIHAPLYYFSYAYSRIFNDMIFGEVCLHRFNFVGVNYDFSMQQVEYGT